MKNVLAVLSPLSFVVLFDSRREKKEKMSLDWRIDSQTCGQGRYDPMAATVALHPSREYLTYGFHALMVFVTTRDTLTTEATAPSRFTLSSSGLLANKASQNY